MKKFVSALFFVVLFVCSANFAYAKDYYACEIENYQAYVDGDGVYEYKSNMDCRAFFAPVKMVQNGKLVKVDNFHFEYDPRLHTYVFFRNSEQEPLMILYHEDAVRIFVVTTKTVLGLNVRV